MKNMKVSAKLMTSFSIVIVLSIVVGIVGIVGMNTITKADTELYEENAVAIACMGEIRELMQRQRVMLRNYVTYAGNVDNISTNHATMESIEKEMEEAFINYEKTILDESVETAYYNAKKVYQSEYADIKRRTYEASLIGMQEAYDVVYAPNVTTAVETIVDGFTEAMDNNNTWAREKSDANDVLAMNLTIIAIIVLAFSVLVALCLVFYISGLISKPLGVLTAFMKKAGATGDIYLTQDDLDNINMAAKIKDEIGQCIGSTSDFIQHMTILCDKLELIANGDLTTEIEVLSEKDTMGVSLRKMVDNLSQMFSEINDASSQVSIGSGQVASGSQSLAQGSTEQASSVEELSASINEVADKTKQNAEMAGEAAGLSDSIKSNAEKGSQQMDHLMQAVNDINEASQSISKVIKVIDDIAFQTNILALNAAVEAARAGQHGKGFAVVADEVRNLAAKSAASAKDTSSLIENSMEKSNLGLNIATETSASLREIVDGIKQSAEIVAKIAKSSNEQAMAISQINTGIGQVSQVIQQNSATAEESAAASEEMSGQSTLLQELVGRFKIKDDKSAQSFGGVSSIQTSHNKPAPVYDTYESSSSFDKY